MATKWKDKIMIKNKKIIIHVLLIISIMLVTNKLYLDNNIKYDYDISHSFDETDIRIFKGTPAWFLSKAVYREDVKKIQKILVNSPELLDYEEPKYGVSIASFAAKKGKLEALYTLVESGLDPDCIIKYWGESMSIFGYFVSLNEWDLDKEFSFISRPFVKYKAKDDYVKLLLNRGANPNIVIKGRRAGGGVEYTTPLIEAIKKEDLNTVMLLVENGAEINYKDEYGITASIVALRWATDAYYNLDTSIINYLIFEKNADLSGTHSYTESDREAGLFTENVGILRDWIFELDSEEYQIKQKYIEKFKTFGQEYNITTLKPYQLRAIKKKYPNGWMEYIERY